jgi:4-diphosphocytidyl-2-C-methyl-D-erythritol kinase
LRLDAPAKINLYLRVLSRRSDGYHSIDSVFAFADAADVLTAAPAHEISLTIDGPNARALQGEADNLVLRAAHAVARMMAVPSGAKLTLTKNLPIAAGIGGGSGDAAATLRLVSELWGLDPDRADLAAMALSLGADVPACLAGETVRVTGIGETLEPVPALPPLEIVLVNNGCPVETASVFKALNGAYSEPAPRRLRFADAASTARICAALGNDLLGAACRIEPSIRDVLAALEAENGCLLAQLSGSGPTCFAIFDTAENSMNAASRLSRDHPDWWVRASRFRDGPAAIEPAD